MTRYDIYTALIGVISVFFSLTVFLGDLPQYVKIFLIVTGTVIFFHSAYTLYRASSKKVVTEKNFIKTAKLFQRGNFTVKFRRLSVRILEKITSI